MAVQWAEADTTLDVSALDNHCADIWMDHRKISPGDVFVALKGEQRDGHQFIASAFQAGACAAIVSKDSVDGIPQDYRDKLIIVADPLKAIQKMAAQYRTHLGIPIIAITGSNGKTTTRNFISHILSSQYTVGTSRGNWNNHIGVPLSILRFTPQMQVGVVELGANHAKEIDVLTRMVKPDIALLTNIGYAHIGNFGSLKKTTDIKFEIVNGMDPRKGVLIINGDDARLVQKSKKYSFKTITFGINTPCTLRAENISVQKNGETRFSVFDTMYQLSIPGRHFIYSALPAIYLAYHFNVPERNIVEAIYSFKPDQLRGGIKEKRGVTFIVDCYNANPSSMTHAITLLVDYAKDKRKCAVVGDMLELGEFTESLHEQLGYQIAKAGIAQVCIVGNNAKHVVAGAEKGGMKSSAIHCASDTETAVNIAREIFHDNDVVLLKGSRAVALEKVFEQF